MDSFTLTMYGLIALLVVGAVAAVVYWLRLLKTREPKEETWEYEKYSLLTADRQHTRSRAVRSIPPSEPVKPSAAPEPEFRPSLVSVTPERSQRYDTNPLEHPAFGPERMDEVPLAEPAPSWPSGQPTRNIAAVEPPPPDRPATVAATEPAPPISLVAPPDEPPPAKWQAVFEALQTEAESLRTFRRLMLLLILPLILLLVVVGGGVIYFQWRLSEQRVEPPVGSVPTERAGEGTEHASRSGINQRAGEAESPQPSGDLSPYFAEAISAETINVRDAEQALGAPDSRSAIIQPGGTLTLTLSGGRYFTNQPGADLRVYGREDHTVRYEILVREGTGGSWQHIDFGRSHGEHDLGHHHIHKANFVEIKNVSETDLAIDAVEVLPGGLDDHH